MMITELIQKKQVRFSYSLEVTPEVSEDDIDKLETEPLFFSITWHARSHVCRDMNIGPLKTARMLTYKRKHVLLHISCDLMRKEYLEDLLVTLQQMNMCNLFLILGENFDRATSDFENTAQLIKFIRKHTGNYFCIGVPGFPDCSDITLQYMKEKINIGVDFIITQAFFDVNTLKRFTEKCKMNNINVPIIPGIYPFESHKQLVSFTNYCKILVTTEFLEWTKLMEELNKSCLEAIKFLIHDLHRECDTYHYHLFSLNKLKRLNNFVRNSIITEDHQIKIS